jgi:hypothetical protein
MEVGSLPFSFVIPSGAGFCGDAASRAALSALSALPAEEEGEETQPNGVT